MRAIRIIAVAALGAALASCTVWRERTVERTGTAADPVVERSARMRSDTASFTADYPRDQRQAGLSEGGAGGAGGSIR